MVREGESLRCLDSGSVWDGGRRWPNGRALHEYTEANGADSSRRTLERDIWLSQCTRNILVSGVDILFVVPC